MIYCMHFQDLFTPPLSWTIWYTPSALLTSSCSFSFLYCPANGHQKPPSLGSKRKGLELTALGCLKAYTSFIWKWGSVAKKKNCMKPSGHSESGAQEETTSCMPEGHWKDGWRWVIFLCTHKSSSAEVSGGAGIAEGKKKKKKTLQLFLSLLVKLLGRTFENKICSFEKKLPQMGGNKGQILLQWNSRQRLQSNPVTSEKISLPGRDHMSFTFRTQVRKRHEHSKQCLQFGLAVSFQSVTQLSRVMWTAHTQCYRQKRQPLFWEIY